VSERVPAAADPTVSAFFDSYRAAFDRLDPEAIADHFLVPAILSTNGAYIAWTARGDVVTNMRTLCARYRTARFRAASWELLDVIVMPPLHVFADVCWTIDHEPPAPSARFRTAYQLRRDGDRWRILLCIAYEEPQ
jgi:hypothetical protein